MAKRQRWATNMSKILQLDGITYARSIEWDWLMLQKKELEAFLESRTFNRKTFRYNLRTKTPFKWRPHLSSRTQVRRCRICLPPQAHDGKDWRNYPWFYLSDSSIIEFEACKKAEQLLETVNRQLKNGGKYFKILNVEPLE